jgi:hypothetical protein
MVPSQDTHNCRLKMLTYYCYNPHSYPSCEKAVVVQARRTANCIYQQQDKITLVKLKQGDANLKSKDMYHTLSLKYLYSVTHTSQQYVKPRNVQLHVNITYEKHSTSCCYLTFWSLHWRPCDDGLISQWEVGAHEQYIHPLPSHSLQSD